MQITDWLILVGAINWGLIGIFDFNLVSSIFGVGIVTNVMYILIGISASISLYKKIK